MRYVADFHVATPIVATDPAESWQLYLSELTKRYTTQGRLGLYVFAA